MASLNIDRLCRFRAFKFLGGILSNVFVIRFSDFLGSAADVADAPKPYELRDKDSELEDHAGVVLECVKKETRGGGVAYLTMYKEPPRASKVFWATRAIKEKNAPAQSTVRKMKPAYVSMLLRICA